MRAKIHEARDAKGSEFTKDATKETSCRDIGKARLAIILKITFNELVCNQAVHVA